MAEELVAEELSQRVLLRIARSIHTQLQQLQAARYASVIRKIEDLTEYFDRAKSIGSKLQKCLQHQWNAAAAEVLSDAPCTIRELPYMASEIEKAIESAEKLSLPTLRDILAELEQAKDEFGELKYDPKESSLSVVTDPIELDGLYLGEFEVRLDISKLPDTRRYGAYRVIALDPHPATSNDVVTHPHVSDEHLCEGDAGVAIGAALSTGRIADFFMLVRSVLTTYNPNSPYVAIDNWDGTPCYDCGCVCGSDDLFYCEACNREFCSECVSYCRVCDTTHCLSCLTECPVCGDRTCESCMTTCSECGRRMCKTCEEDKQCPCHEERKDEEDNDPDSTDNQTAAGADTPVGTGQQA